jgi:endo-1,4-beta-mannosidase
MYPAGFSGWGSTTFPTFIDLILDMAESAHLNTLRATDILLYGDWHNMTLWNNLDYLVQHAAQRHIWIIIDLSTFRNSLDKQGIFAYNPADWQDFVSFIAQRYKNVPNIAYYEIAGEPQDPNRDAGREPTAEQLITFYQSISDLIYANDGNHLVGTGSFAHLNASQNINNNCTVMTSLCIPWQQIYALQHIDLPGMHIYSANDLNISLPMVQQWTNSHNKPFSIDEFGFKQSIGDTVRAVSFDNIYNNVQKYSNNVNIIFWNLGPQMSTTAYEVNPQTPLTWQIVQDHAP